MNEPGIMPLALERIVEMAEVRGSKVEVSFFEVYMDRCYDLLEPKEADITVLDDGHGRVQLRGLAQVICTLLICLLALCCNQHHSAYGNICSGHGPHFCAKKNAQQNVSSSVLKENLIWNLDFLMSNLLSWIMHF